MTLVQWLEFEPLYRAEANKRQGTRTDIKGDSTLMFGQTRKFMSKEASAGEDGN